MGFLVCYRPDYHWQVLGDLHRSDHFSIVLTSSTPSSPSPPGLVSEASRLGSLHSFFSIPSLSFPLHLLTWIYLHLSAFRLLIPLFLALREWRVFPNPIVSCRLRTCCSPPEELVENLSETSFQPTTTFLLTNSKEPLHVEY